MPFYHFHIENFGGRTVDEEGTDLDNEDEARALALVGVRSVLAEEITERGVMDLRGHVEVTDASGNRLFAILFPDAIEVIR